MIRFFISPEDIRDDSVCLSPGDVAHMRSLRLRPSELFTVCDGKGVDYICRLGAESGKPIALIVEKLPSCGEPSVRCVAYVALAKGDRLDYAVQKSVELGAHEIALFPTARCIAIPSNMHNKLTRLKKIALETAKQCGRGYVPVVSAKESFSSAIEQAACAQISLFFYEQENELSLKAALEQESAKANDGSSAIKSISIVTGPEGGFEPFEADMARDAGLLSVSLGRRILRCETAPIAALTAIMFFYDEL